jgi:serine O-acetyltransferase
VSQTLRQTLLFLEGLIRLELQYDARVRGPNSPKARTSPSWPASARDFAGTLPMVRAELDADLAASFHQESGVRSMDEMLLWHPGMRALLVHRLAHRLHQAGLPLLARMASELARVRTGIDIHPAARVGAGCALQRATGVVIPEAR